MPGDASGTLDDDAEDLYQHAPCGYLSTRPDGRIVRVNATLLGWLGAAEDDLVGARYFSDLLTVGGKLYYETHLGPLLAMQGKVGGIALELRAADGRRMPVLVSSVVKAGPAGEPALIRTTVAEAGDRRAYERELLRARQEAERERERLQVLVKTLQHSLLPPALPDVPGLETAAYYHPASRDEVGGDFYDLFPLSTDRCGLFLGDVAGKGAQAATVTSLIRYTLRAAAVYDPDPAAVLGTLDAALPQGFAPGEGPFCSVIFGLLAPDGDGYRLTLARGGHPDPVLIRADGTADFLALPGGPIVGAFDHAVFRAATIRLAPGDTLLLYTDGLTEARTDAVGGRYGEESLRALAASLAPATAASVVAAVISVLDGLGGGVQDDTALLALSVPAARTWPAAGLGLRCVIMTEIVLRVRLISGEYLDVTYTAAGGTTDEAAEHAISTLAADSGTLRCLHGNRLVILYGRGVATLEVAPRGAVL
jgi:sigma-B regulation protein RsbU (phosphoserine phosphatase)